MYDINTTLIGPSAGTPEDFIRIAEERGSARIEDVRSYVKEVYRLCRAAGLRAEVLIVQGGFHETAVDGVPWASRWWRERANPAGIGITGDPAQNAASRDFGDGRTAARAHVVHLWLYAVGKTLPGILAPYQGDDPRWDAAVAAGRAGVARTLGGLTGTWAADPQYDVKIARLLNALEPFAPSPSSQAPASPAEGTIMAKPYILILAGHRATEEVGTGAPGERDITDDMARAATEAFRARGYETNWWHRDLDRDDLPDQTRGTLTDVINGVRDHLRAWRASNPDRMAVLLDFNFNGAESPQHVLVADGAGLRSAYADGNVAADTMANNPLDVRLASQIARNIVAAIPGTTLFGGSGTPKTPGVMSEKTSGVGGTGWRLGVFGGTAIFRDWLVRCILETGGTNDFRRYPDFANRVAKATVAAVDAVMGEANGQSPAPETRYVRAVKEILVRAAPDVTARVGFVLAPGEVAAVIDPTPRPGSGLSWIDVRVEGRGTGFVPVGDVEAASAPAPPAPPQPKGATFRTRYRLPLRGAPGFAGAITGDLAEGTAGEILEGPRDADGIGWYRVRLASGEGWVPASIVRTLEIDG